MCFAAIAAFLLCRHFLGMHALFHLPPLFNGGRRPPHHSSVLSWEGFRCQYVRPLIPPLGSSLGQALNSMIFLY